jgi:hypothetical protein
VHPPCSLRLCGESFLEFIHHRVTEGTEDAQREIETRTLPTESPGLTFQVFVPADPYLLTSDF